MCTMLAPHIQSYTYYTITSVARFQLKQQDLQRYFAKTLNTDEVQMKKPATKYPTGGCSNHM